MIALSAPEFWWEKPGLAAKLLSPVGFIYGDLAAWRLKRPGYRAPMPVICVGNPTLGGAGKTPAAIAIAKLLQADGKRPHFLSRGYGGSIAGPTAVDTAHSAKEVGDEALLLAKVAPTIVARNRAAGAKLAGEMRADVLVLDDGFQNPSLKKDLSILVIDATRGIGNGMVFPAGPLRAPLRIQFERAQAILLVGDDELDAATSEAAAKAGLAVLRGRIVPDAEAMATIKRKGAFAFAGIGDPGKFFRTIENGGVKLFARQAFPDHHRYSAADADALIARAENAGLQLVTTEKDHVRMAGNPTLGILHAKSRVLPVTMQFDDVEAVKRLLVEVFKRENASR